MIEEAKKPKLYALAEMIFQDSVGSTSWSMDKSDLDDREFRDYNIGNGETVAIVSSEECDFVLDEVYNHCDTCAGCYWVWWREDMGEHYGELYCSQCVEEQELESEDDYED